MSSPGALKILMVTAMYPSAENGGRGTFVMHQVEQLRTMGHQVDVLYFPGNRSKWAYLKAAIEVFRRTQDQQYSVVHAHYGTTGLTSLFRNSVPMVVTLHGSDALVGPIEPLISKFVSKMADATIVVSSQIAKRIPGDIIPCGVDSEVFVPKPKTEARQRLGLDSKTKYVLFPFNPQRTVKRFSLADAAVKKLFAEGNRVELLTASKVHFSEMPWYYSAADVMILCSESEGSPTSVKEALSCNLPVVSTDVGDVQEILRNVSGVEIVKAEVDALASGLMRTLHPPEGFAFNGRLAMERYSQRRTAESLVAVYRRIIDQRGNRSQKLRGKITAKLQASK